MGGMAILSVVIPAFQAERTIAACLDSLLCTQVAKAGRMQIIVVDDGSTDDTAEICSSYAQQDEIVLLRQRNEGRSSARNVGVEACSGDWVTFVDADDEVAPQGFSEALKLLGKGGFDVLQTAFGSSHGSGRVEQFDGSEVARHIALNGMAGSPDLLAWAADSVMFRAVWAKFYRKTVLHRVRFGVGLRFGEDALFNIQCLQGAHVVCADFTTYYHDVNAGGTSATYSESDFGSLDRLLDAAAPVFRDAGYGDRALREFVGLDAYYRFQMAAEKGVRGQDVCAMIEGLPDVKASLASLANAQTPLATRNRPALLLLARGDVAGAYRITRALQLLKAALRRGKCCV